MAIKDFLEVQIGTESTWGSSATATAKLMQVTDLKLTPEYKITVRKHLLGTLTPGKVATLVNIGGSAQIVADADYEDFPYWLDCMFGTASPGAGPGYTRTWTAPVAAGAMPANPRFLTIYGGEAGGTIYKLIGGTATKLVLKGDVNGDGFFTITQDFIGKEVISGSLATLSDRTVTPAVASHFDLWIDSLGGTIGTTNIPNSALSFELSLDVNRIVRRYLGPNAIKPYAYAQKGTMSDANTLTLSCDETAVTKAYLDAILAGATVGKLIRLKATSATSQVIQLDFAGTLSGAPVPFTDQDGIRTLDLKLQALEDGAPFGGWFKATVTNNVASMP